MVLEKLNDEQMEILLDFADRCRYLCFGRPPTGRDAEIIAYKQWKELSRDLNYAGNLPWKSGREWKMYWTELKNKTKAKLATAKRRSKFTGEPLHLNNFSLWEQRIIELAEVAAKEPRTKHVFSENGDGDTTDSIPNDIICEPKFESTPNTSQNGNSQVTPLDMSNTYTTQLQPDATHASDATYAPAASHAPNAPHAPQYVSTGTQMVATPGIKKSMPPPIMHGYSAMPQFISIPPGVSLPPGISLPPQAPPSQAPIGPMYQQSATPPNNTSTGHGRPGGGEGFASTGGCAGAGDTNGLSALSSAVQQLARANMSIADALMALSTRVTSNK